MDVEQFKQELTSALNSLSYVESIEFWLISETYIKGKVLLKRDYALEVRYTTFNRRYSFTLSFTLLFENNRIWGLDKDNRIGWHIHPIDNTEMHEPIEEKSISEIVQLFDSVVSQLL